MSETIVNEQPMNPAGRPIMPEKIPSTQTLLAAANNKRPLFTNNSPPTPKRMQRWQKVPSLFR